MRLMTAMLTNELLYLILHYIGLHLGLLIKYLISLSFQASALSWGSDANLNEFYLTMIYQQYLHHNMPEYQQRYYQDYWETLQQYAN